MDRGGGGGVERAAGERERGGREVEREGGLYALCGGERERVRWGEMEVIYIPLYCHHQNDSCIKTGSDESHFNVLIIVRDKVTRQCPQITNFEEKGEAEADSNRVLLLTSLTPYR